MNLKSYLLYRKGNPLFLKYLHSGSGLPKDYQRVNYLEGSGTQYIDTNAIANNNSKVFVDIQLTAMEGPTGIVGKYRTSTKRFRIYRGEDGNSLYFGIGSGNVKKSFEGTSILNRCEMILDAKNQKAYYNNIEFGPSGFAKDITGDDTIYIFASNQSSIRPAQAKLYSSKIWDDDVLIRDLIPCIRKSDNKPGLYDVSEPKDTIKERFYTNIGSGEFGYEYNGQKVEPVSGLSTAMLNMVNMLNTNAFNNVNEEYE